MAYIITVSNPGSGNRYYVDSVLQQQLSFQEGSTHRFDQSDSSNSGHPLRLSATANGTHGGGSEYTTGVTTSGTPGQAGAYTEITVAYGAPTLYYYCTAHSGMGGQVKIVVLKNFEVNGPVVVGKDTKVTVGTVTSGAVDLSTGNYFVDTPTGAYTYSFNNPGSVQAFQIEATGGSAAVASAFSTTLYTGNNAAQTITNNINLSGDGGMVWGKVRDYDDGAWLVDSLRGTGSNGTFKYLQSASSTDAASDFPNVSVSSFNNNGFTLTSGNDYQFNRSPQKYVSWTFKKQAKFFDMVTFTGNGLDDRVLSHSLGSTPGMVIMKRTSSGTAAQGAWFTYHIGAGFSGGLSLNGTESAGYTYASPITAASNTTVTINNPANNGNINASGATYVAYLFAHDTDASSLIKCGTCSGESGSNRTINLGWEPQWLLTKSAAAVGNWAIVDTQRGFLSVGQSGTSARIKANLTQAETTTDGTQKSSTGFYVNGLPGSGNYIYMAIRSAAAPAITWPTSIEWTQGTTPKTPAEGATDVYTFTTDDGGTTYTGIQSIDTAS